MAATKELEAYQESEDAPEDMAKIPVLNREDITEEIAPVYNTEKEIDGIKLVHHEIESNGIGYATLMFDLSGVSEELLPYTGILQSVLGIIDTNNYGYGELFNEINVHTGGIGTSLELYPDVTKAKEKDFRATFEIKGKALYPQMKILFAMMREILMESRLDDEKRLKRFWQCSNPDCRCPSVFRTYDIRTARIVLWISAVQITRMIPTASDSMR